MIPTIQSTIPADWRVQELGSLCSRIVGGGTPSRNVKIFWEGDIPWATVKDISGFNATDTIEHISKEAVNKSATQVIPSGTIIIATRMSVGNPVIYSVDTAINQDLKALFTKEEVNKEYLVYFLRAITPMLDEIASGTTVKGLSLEILTKQMVLLPTNEAEQYAIATALSDVDALIEAKQALLEKKRAIKQGAMQELLTGKRRLPGFPVTSMKNTELGDIPEDWEVKTLGRCASIARGGSPRPIESYLTTSPEGVNWIKIGDVSPGAKYIEHTEEKILPSGAKHSRKVKPGDLLLSNSMSYGRPYILSLDGCIHDGWLTIADYDSEFHRDYLYYALGSSIVVNQYEGLAAGTGVKNLNKKIVAGVQVPCPRDFDEQAAIASVLSDMDDELVSLERELEKLLDLKRGMMKELLTGRIRLVD